MDAKQIVKIFNKGIEEYFKTGKMDKFLSVVDPNVKLRVPGMPDNLEGLKQVLPAFQQAFSDFEMTVNDVIADSDIVYCRITWTATHTGELMGIAPTNKKITVSETHFDKIANGKIIEHGGNWDQMGMMQQIGAIPGM